MICIEVAVSRDKAQDVAPVLMQCCAQTGDRLLGGRVDTETEEVVFLVQLTQDPHLSAHLPVLSGALQQGLIVAFQFAQGSVLKLTAPHVDEHVHQFPLSFGDSWVPGLQNVEDIYLCIARPLLTARQAAWLHLQENMHWEYV
ncbi:MAG TPA: hypothetical protein VL485_20495 [Ktedonobacteraceae bacterium]|nr:hypothetical protein [Ktedonobacteraceae bacterium]